MVVLGEWDPARAQAVEQATPAVQTAGEITLDGPPPPVAPAVASRGSDGRATFRANRLTGELKVDGNLDEAVYRTIPPITDFYQMEPNNGQLATERTEAWILFDNDTLYVSILCYDSAPEERWVANEMRRDSRTISRQNEAFHISFDTFYDRRNAQLFTITPIGGIFDGQITNETVPANADWNPVWDRAVGRFPGGWTAEMAIPFKSLRYKPERNQVWGMMMLRLVRWKNEQSFVVPLSRNIANGIFQVSRYATLVGIEAPPRSRNLEFKPYAISNLTSDRVADPVDPDDVDADAGFDFKYVVTQNLTADFTYNTDFAQVEVDEQQVNLTRFALFFPEKREFFLEGAGLFEFAGTGTGNVPALFYSRQIGISQGRPVPIDAGGRLTGKIGKFAVGLLNVRTEDQQARAVPATNFSVVRLRRDVLRRSNVGLLYTRRSQSIFVPGANDTVGADATFGFRNDVNITTYLAKTTTPGITSNDTSYRTQFVFSGDRYGFTADRLAVGAGFNPEVGFVRRRDFKETFGSARFSPRPRNSRKIRRYTSQVSYDYITDSDDRLDTRSVTGSFGITLQNGDSFDASVDNTLEVLPGPFRIARGVTIPAGEYTYNQFVTSYLFGLQRRIAGTVSFEQGSFYGGDRTAVGYRAARIEVSPQISVEPSVSIVRVDLPEGSFTSRLMSSRATFTVTPRMFVSGLAQYNSSSHTVSSNLRLRWEYHPGSELFVVYTDEHDTGAPNFPLVSNRAFSVKINRLLRF
jgi:hypothetical protein